MSDNHAGRYVWFELMTTDTKAAIAFYTEVVGWKTQAWENDYTMWVGSSGPLGGAMALPEQARKMGAPPHWIANVAVTDVDKIAARTKELGGQVFAGPMDIPKIGRYAVLGDPQGAVFAVVATLQPMAPHDSTKHGEFCWSELLTTDQNAAMAFYKDLFGWQLMLEHPMGPMGTYFIYGIGGQQLGGMMNKPPQMQMPPAFMHYVQVDKLDDALARAKNHGAKVLNGPMEVPGGARIVQLMDPQGAAFSLHELPKAK
jgi:predicted enzyme related to lactoylglutathione lyase